MAVIIALVGLAIFAMVVWVAPRWQGNGLPPALAEAQVKARKARAAMPPADGLAVYLADAGPGQGAGWYRPGHGSTATLTSGMPAQATPALPPPVDGGWHPPIAEGPGAHHEGGTADQAAWQPPTVDSPAPAQTLPDTAPNAEPGPVTPPDGAQGDAQT